MFVQNQMITGYKKEDDAVKVKKSEVSSQIKNKMERCCEVIPQGGVPHQTEGKRLSSKFPYRRLLICGMMVAAMQFFLFTLSFFLAYLGGGGLFLPQLKFFFLLNGFLLFFFFILF